MLEKRSFGKTGMSVSRLALGGLPLAGRYTRGHATEIIRRAAELGINFIDTSPSYFDSELQIGQALKKVDAEFIIGTKMGNFPYGGFPAQDPVRLRTELEKSFAHLQRDKVDILYVHEPDRPDFHDWWTDKENYEGPVLDLLREYRDKGKVRFLGLAGTTTTEMARIIRTRKFQIVLTAFQYSLLWQEARFSVFPAAKEAGMGIVCGSALQQGALAKPYLRDVQERRMPWLSEPRREQWLALYEFVEDCGMPLPELALRFVLSNPDVSTVLSGVKTVAELEQNVAAAEKGPLPQEYLDRIEEIYRMVPFRPFGEPFSPAFTTQFEEFEAQKAEYEKYVDQELK